MLKYCNIINLLPQMAPSSFVRFFYDIVISKNITCLLSFQNVFAFVNSLVSAITIYTAFLLYVCHDHLCNSSFLIFTLSWTTMFKVCLVKRKWTFSPKKLNRSLYSLLVCGNSFSSCKHFVFFNEVSYCIKNENFRCI